MLNEANLSAISPPLRASSCPSRPIGNPDLKQETMTAFEIGYSGIVRNRATLSAAVYWNTMDDGIYFTQVGSYTPANPPPRGRPRSRPSPSASFPARGCRRSSATATSAR